MRLHAKINDTDTESSPIRPAEYVIFVNANIAYGEVGRRTECNAQRDFTTGRGGQMRKNKPI